METKLKDINSHVVTLGNYREKIEYLQKQIESFESKYNLSSETGHKPLTAKIQRLYSTLCEVHLENGKLEAALIQSAKGLSYASDENLYTINFLCLHNLNFRDKARRVLYRCHELYPGNSMFRSYLEEYRSNGSQNPVVSESTIASPVDAPVIDQDKLKMMENLDDNQINSMVGMMKGMNSKEHFEKISGRTLSDQEYHSMMNMMNPETIKTAMNMMKGNPELIKNLSNNTQSPLANLPTSKDLDTSPKNTISPGDSRLPNMPNSGLPNELMGSGGPNILENRAMIRSVLQMFKDNPKGMLGSFAQMSNNPQLNALSNISERKLKVIANILYYIIAAGLEALYYTKKYKAQIVVVLIALLIYKLI